MLTIFDRNNCRGCLCDGLTRRTFLKIGGMGPQHLVKSGVAPIAEVI